jgi:hypothetical protein
MICIFNLINTIYITYTEKDLINSKSPRKDDIVHANGVCYPVSAAADVNQYSNLTFKNTLVISSSSSKLVYIGYITKELNNIFHIFPDCCMFQDIKTKRILDHGTRIGGLYFLDELKTGDALLNINSTDMENKILLWHKQLGIHPLDI